MHHGTFLYFLCLQPLKKHSRTSPDIQFKEFQLTKKLDLERTMSESGKPFRKKNQIKEL